MEIKVGSLDGNRNISDASLYLFANAVRSFGIEGIEIALTQGLTLGQAFHRYVSKYKSKCDYGHRYVFDINDIEQTHFTKGGKEEAPALTTYCRSLGMISETLDTFGLSPMGQLFIDRNITSEEYALLLLSKQGVFVNKEYKGHLLSYFADYSLTNETLTQDGFYEYLEAIFSDSLSNGEEVSFQGRSDILFNALLYAGIISIDGDAFSVEHELVPLLQLFIDNRDSFTPAPYKNEQLYKYAGATDNGLFEILNDSNIEIFQGLYPNIRRWYKKDDSFISHSDIKQIKSSIIDERNNTLPHLQIVYGAPGTGKSYCIEEDIHKYGMKDIRTTFHPDSDYATFVGTYKPQMEKVDIIGPQGIPTGKTEKRIVYKFTKQAFLKAYIDSWKDLNTPHVLVIEELNRGNCAQIFGDLFQLLDYNDGNFSKYPISADADLELELCNEFENLTIEDADAIDSLYKEPVVKRVKKGEILLLPSNLYIWATMNTSDPSLFPIASAFKRRWGWKYIPIRNANKGWQISVNGLGYDWWSFIEEINKKIGSTTMSEDKKLGYFFCKADKKTVSTDKDFSLISADRFVCKVLFYVYNDVFKDYGFDDDIFKDKDDMENSELTFQSLFMPDGRANGKKVQRFLDNLGVKKVSEMIEDIIEEDNIENEEEPNNDHVSDVVSLEDAEAKVNDHTRYNFDGQSSLGKGALAISVVEKYMNEHPGFTFDELKKVFPDSMMGDSLKLIGFIVKDKDVADTNYSYQKKAYGFFKKDRKYTDANNQTFFVSNYWNITNIQSIIDFAKSQGWDVTTE